MKTIAIIDLDVVIFRAAAACEKRSINVTHVASGREKSFKTRTEFRSFIKGTKWKEEEFIIQDVQTAEPVANACYTVKSMVKNIQQAIQPDETIFVLDGGGNFRKKLPLPSEYKGQRKDSLPPLLREELSEYVRKKYSPIQAHGCESDDIVSELAYKLWIKGYKGVVCSNDKDARGFPCYFYDFTKEEPEILAIDNGIGELWLDDKGKVRGKGYKWLCTQWLIGDSSDNYKPTELSGVEYGEKSAFKLLAPLQTKQEVFDSVVSTYKQWYPEPFKYKCWENKWHDADWQSMLELYLKCCHMQIDGVVSLKWFMRLHDLKLKEIENV